MDTITKFSTVQDATEELEQERSGNENQTGLSKTSRRLVGHYVVKVFAASEASDNEAKELECAYCGMHEEIEALFMANEIDNVDYEITNEMPWNGCDCV